METTWIKEFTQSQNCGSTERFCRNMAKELRERGLAREEWNFYFDDRMGAAIDPSKAPMLIIGTSIPGYHICTDICEDCGTIYAVKLERVPAKTTPGPSQGPPGMPRNPGFN